MNRWDERPDEFRRARLELLKAQHRKSLVEPEEAKPEAPKPRLPTDIDAVWDAPRSR
jgi:hypothetical protein